MILPVISKYNILIKKALTVVFMIYLHSYCRPAKGGYIRTRDGIKVIFCEAKNHKILLLS